MRKGTQIRIVNSKNLKKQIKSLKSKLKKLKKKLKKIS